ncbi:MAG: DUF2213 domain-containing protein [Clostridia bacterium]
MQYYGTRLSENISRREPEGYLLCLNVPVARTGTQDYLPEELGITPGSSSFPSGPGGLVSVYRPEEEVFAPETMASFEGMPVTNDHPPDGVDVENIRRLQTGHAHNIRRGTGSEADLLLADLIITDERLIEAILGGKREISCGYTYELAEENGRYIQRKIRGNHIAVVDAGRAGPRVSIKDHKGPKTKAPPAPSHLVSIKDHKQPERSTSTMKKSLSKLLARMAKDGDVEAVAEFIEEMIEGEPETKAKAAAETVEEVAEAVAGAVAEAVSEAGNGNADPERATDEETLSGIIERLDRLIELLTIAPAAGDEDPEELCNAAPGELCAEEVAEAIEEVIEAAEAAEGGEKPPEDNDTASGGLSAEEVGEIVEAILEPDISTTLEEVIEGDEDPDDPEGICSNDALHTALQIAAPMLMKMNRKQRRKAAADIAAQVRKNRRKAANRGYDRVMNPRIQRDSRSVYNALGKRIMAARNANYKGRG